MVDGTALLEQLLDVVSKELDQMGTSSSNIPRLEMLYTALFLLPGTLLWF